MVSFLLMYSGIARTVVGLTALAVSALASDITGIWTGQQQGRRGEPEDVAFRFKIAGESMTGKMFGDEFDIPVEELSISDGRIRFTITTTNYYSRTRVKYIYTGTITGSVMELERERVQTPEEKAANRPVNRQSLRLKRVS